MAAGYRALRHALSFVLVAVIAAGILSLANVESKVVRASLWGALVLGLVLAIHELVGKPLPFLRWSVLRMGIGARRLFREWQVGDGREEEVAVHVAETTAAGDLDGVIAAIDDYAYQQKFLINVGDEKGALLDDVIRRTRPQRVLELGAYVGYSALRMARVLPPGAHLYTVEWSAANARIAQRILAHAGVSDRVTVVHGSLGDGGKTMSMLTETCGFGSNVDLVFIDHDKNQYVADLERILAARWCRPGSVVVADNVLFPGAPQYRAFIKKGEGTRWTTRVHHTHGEYQSLMRDIVLESTLLSG